MRSVDGYRIGFHSANGVGALCILLRLSRLSVDIGSQLKTANDTGHGQKFMFVEPNAITLSRVKAPLRRHTTPQAATPPKEVTSLLGSDPATMAVQMEQPMRAEWDVENLSGFDAHVMDFGNMLWDVDIYESAEGIRCVSPSDTPVPHGKSALLESCGSDVVVDTTAEASVTVPPARTSSDCCVQKQARCCHGTVIHESDDPLSASLPIPALPAPPTEICFDNSMGSFAGYAALHLAARQGRLAIIKLLVEKGQPIDQLSDNRRTALSLALEGDHIEVMQYLLEQGAFPDALNGNGSTVLHLAAKRGQRRAVELLLKYMKDPNAIDHNGCSALHIAVAEGQTDIVRLILECGVDAQLKITIVDA